MEEAFAEEFGEEMPEILNENQHMVVVASEIDNSSARIIGFLSDAYGVRVNAVTFNYFRSEDGRLAYSFAALLMLAAVAGATLCRLALRFVAEFLREFGDSHQESGAREGTTVPREEEERETKTR